MALRKEEEYPLSELTQAVIGAALEVHRELGAGFLEKVYETALSRELQDRGLSAACQAPIPVSYKGVPVGNYYADLPVEQKVVCEIKAAGDLNTVHQAQLLNYLKAT